MRTRWQSNYERSKNTSQLRAVTNTAAMYDSDIENDRRSILLLYSPRTCFTYFSLRNELLTDSSNACRHRRFSLHAHCTSVYNTEKLASVKLSIIERKKQHSGKWNRIQLSFCVCLDVDEIEARRNVTFYPCWCSAQNWTNFMKRK